MIVITMDGTSNVCIVARSVTEKALMKCYNKSSRREKMPQKVGGCDKMCHLILVMPILALPIFWLTSLNYSLPIYIVIVLTSGLLCWLIGRSMGSRPAIGAESLVGGEAEVVSKLNPEDHAQYLVRASGELWSAFAPEPLQLGEIVRIATLDGVRLTVERGSSNSVATGRRNRC